MSDEKMLGEPLDVQITRLRAALAMWEQVWDNVKLANPDLRSDNKPLAVAACYQLQKDALAAAEQRAAEDRKDAERYRWLKKQHEGHEDLAYDADGLPIPMEPTALAFTVFRPDETGTESLVPVGCIPGELDSAIDAAIAKEQP